MEGVPYYKISKLQHFACCVRPLCISIRDIGHVSKWQSVKCSSANTSNETHVRGPASHLLISSAALKLGWFVIARGAESRRDGDVP